MFKIALFYIYTTTKKDYQKRLKIEKVIREKLRGDKTFETDFNKKDMENPTSPHYRFTTLC